MLSASPMTVNTAAVSLLNGAATTTRPPRHKAQGHSNYEPADLVPDLFLRPRRTAALLVLANPWVFAWPTACVAAAAGVSVLSGAADLSDDWIRCNLRGGWRVL